jgi:cytoskeleton protein RodZ
MSIGQQLRQAREEQSLSLDQVAQATHIRLHYLEALEADQFDKLPSTTQLRGFLRTYANYLKLDSIELIRELEVDSSRTPAIPSPVATVEESQTSQANTGAIFVEVGQKLQSQRELMGLTLEDVERHTHIRMHYLQALEMGDIAHLPSPVQGRGMLSNYASFLGLDTDAILLRFADGLQASLYGRLAARNASILGQRHFEENGMPARPSQLKRLFSLDLFAGGFLVLFILGFIIWGALRISNLHAGQVPSSSAPPVSEILLSTPGEAFVGTVTSIPSTSVSSVPTIVDNTSPMTGTEVTAVTETPIVVGPVQGNAGAPIQVYVIAHQRVWMRVTVDGQVVFEERVVPGSAYSFAGSKRIELLTGDGSSLQVYFNQQDLGQLGSYGEVVERIFSIEGVQTPTPAVPITSTSAPTSTSTVTPTPTPTILPINPTPTRFP